MRSVLSVLSVLSVRGGGGAECGEKLNMSKGIEVYEEDIL